MKKKKLYLCMDQKLSSPLISYTIIYQHLSPTLLYMYVVNQFRSNWVRSTGLQMIAKTIF